MVSGTPVATVVLVPNDDVMSLRTTPLWLSTSGPFEPSPGYGPAVSSGISVVQSAAATAEALDDADADALALADEPAPGAQAAIPRLMPASPMPLSTRRRSSSVWMSKARPWSHAGSVGSGRGRPSNMGGASAVRVVSAVMASPVGPRRVAGVDAQRLPINPYDSMTTGPACEKGARRV